MLTLAAMSERLRVHVVPQLRDNYAYLLICEDSGAAAVVDCSEPDPVLALAQAEGVSVGAILTTHHHWDHVGGNEELAARFPGLRIYGPASDAGRLPAMTDGLGHGETLRLGQHEATALHLPGHTTGHTAWWFQGDRLLFPGDTLFGAGCGRLFEGTPAMMAHSLREVLGVVPDDTDVYPGHEYTASNIRFARTVDPDNDALAERQARVEALRARGEPTVPYSMGEDRATNPFLRTHTLALRRAAVEQGGLDPSEATDPAAVLGAIRTLKDGLKG